MQSVVYFLSKKQVYRHILFYVYLNQKLLPCKENFVNKDLWKSVMSTWQIQSIKGTCNIFVNFLILHRFWALVFVCYFQLWFSNSLTWYSNLVFFEWNLLLTSLNNFRMLLFKLDLFLMKSIVDISKQFSNSFSNFCS